jgi:hypothetical protein
VQGVTLNQAARISVFVGLLLSLGPASAAPPVELPSAKFRVVISPEGGIDPWVSEAFEKQIVQDLAKQSRLIPTEHLKPPGNKSCGDIPSMECILKIHQAQGIQIYLAGEVSPSRLSYKVFDTETQRSVATGGVSIRSPAALRRLKLDVSRATKPFLERGGLIEQSHQDTASAHTQLIQTLTLTNRLSRRVESDKEEYRDIAIKVLAALFLVPMLAVFLSRTGQKRIKRSRARLVWVWLAILVLAGTFGFLNETQPEAMIRYTEPYLSLFSERYSWVLFMLGGMVWGWLFIVNLRFVLSPVPGLETIGSRLLGGLLQSWTIKIAFRSTLLLILYSAFLLSAWFAATAYDVRPDYLWLAVLPLCALLAIFTIAAVLENISFYLDSAYVEGEATTENPWHERVTSYLESFHGPLSEFTLSNLLILPGRVPGVIVYGGATSSIRVVVNHRLLELGLGTRVVNNDLLFDPVEYDFLLGTLHQALGRIHQGHHLSDTFRHWTRCLWGPEFSAQRRPFITAHRFLMRPLKDRLNHSTIMSDAFAALNAGLHQLVQSLYLDLTGEFRLLTTEGHSTDLNRTSQKIFFKAQDLKDVDTRSQILISRITWLSQYTHFPMAMSKKLSPLFVLTLAVISIGLLSLSTYVVSDSIAYHPTYVSRIQEQTLALEEKIIEMEQRGNDNDQQ